MSRLATIAEADRDYQVVEGHNTVREALAAAFGDSYKNIQGLDTADIVDSSDSRVEQAGPRWASVRLAVSEHGSPFIVCGGGEVIASIDRIGRDRQGTIFVILDSTEHDQWMWKRAQGEAEGVCPRRVMRLVYSI